MSGDFPFNDFGKNGVLHGFYCNRVYTTLMNILRKLSLVLLGGILSLSLLVLVWSHIITTVAGNQETVKGWLNKSGFYDQIVDVALEAANNSEGSSQDIPVQDPGVKATISEALSP